MKHISYSFSNSDIEAITFALTILPSLGIEETEAQANQSYFTTADEAVVYTGCEGEAITPYTSTVGQQEKSVWKWTGTYFQYYDENGNLETIAQLEAKAKAAGTYTGYFKINEDYYCLDSEGKPQTGEITLTVNGESNLYLILQAATFPEKCSTMDGFVQIPLRESAGCILKREIFRQTSVNIISVA